MGHGSYQAIAGIRATLGPGLQAVPGAYGRLGRRSQETILTRQRTPANRLRRAWSASTKGLESLPPFWTVFALTLTETVGAGILALPIALAEVGPLPGVVILLVLGVVNVVTIAAMAEAVARNGGVRNGNAFIGRVVTDYLGRAGSLILSLGLIIECVLTLWPYYIGLSTTLADATGVPAPAWVALLFFVGLCLLRRETLNATVASALVIGAVNIGLILILSLLAFAHMERANLSYMNVPLVDGRPFEPSILRLIFGVILLAYFGHLSVSNCARDVLRRDPSSRSLIWGTVAAQLVVMAIYCIWVVAVNGAVGPGALTGISGTALAPLAAEIGPVVHVLGSVFVILAMGMGTIHSSLPLFNLVRERLPTGSCPTVILPGRQRPLLLGQHGCFLLSAAPIIVVFLLVEWMLLVGKGSFAEPLGFLGVIVISLLGGVFPMLLLVAGRHKGEIVPGVVYRMLGHPVLTTGIYLLYLAVLFLHGLAIWQNPVQRVAAVAIGVMMLGVTVRLVRRGTFGARGAVTLQGDRIEMLA